MGVLSWFKRADDADFERVLEQLDESIQVRERNLADIRQRERRASRLFTSYALALWIAYVGVWYAGFLHVADILVVRAFWAAPLALGPVVIVFTRRTFRWWYRRKQNHEEKVLKVLQTKQREQVDRLKKRTRYDETRSLLERYDEKIRKNSEAGRFPAGTGSPAPVRSAAGTPFGSPGPAGRGRGIASVGPSTPARAAGMASPAAQGSPASRGWVDRFADKILGDDEATPSSRYALICGKCFQHNGLVLRSELATTQYVCPKCSHFNPPKPSSLLATSVDDAPAAASAPRTRTTSAHSALSPAATAATTNVARRHSRPHSLHDLPEAKSLRVPAPPRPSSATGAGARPFPRMSEASGESESEGEEEEATSSPLPSPSDGPSADQAKARDGSAQRRTREASASD